MPAEFWTNEPDKSIEEILASYDQAQSVPVTKENRKVGLRVTKGPDWNLNQNGSCNNDYTKTGIGIITATAHPSFDYFTKVKWDDTKLEAWYRVERGPSDNSIIGGYELATYAPNLEVLIPVTQQNKRIGMRVKRGIDWGNPRNIEAAGWFSSSIWHNDFQQGIIIELTNDGIGKEWVKIRWNDANGKIIDAWWYPAGQHGYALAVDESDEKYNELRNTSV